MYFFFNDTSTTENYTYRPTLSLHDALPSSKEYENVVDAAAYSRADSQGVDAFQSLYNEVANDIVNHRKKLKPENYTEIRRVADLRLDRKSTRLNSSH